MTNPPTAPEILLKLAEANEATEKHLSNLHALAAGKISPHQLEADQAQLAWLNAWLNQIPGAHLRALAAVLVEVAGFPTVSEDEAMAGGRWIAAEDVLRMARQLDVALSGKDAAPQPRLVDVVGEVVARLAAPTPQPAREALRVVFNLNEYIYVRLTQKALDYLRAEHERWIAAHGLKVDYVSPELDENGYCAFQAWAFIQSFGRLFPGYTRCWEEWFEDGFNVQLDPRLFRECAALAEAGA